MPIEPPDPGKILDALRAIETDLRALDEMRPGVLSKVALASVEVAIVAMTDLAHVKKAR